MQVRNLIQPGARRNARFQVALYLYPIRAEKPFASEILLVNKENFFWSDHAGRR